MMKELSLDEMQHIEKSLCWNCDRGHSGCKNGIYAVYCFEYGDMWFNEEIASPNSQDCFQCGDESQELEIIKELKSFEIKLEGKRRNKLYEEVIYDMRYNDFHCEYLYEKLELALIHFGKNSKTKEDLKHNMNRFIIFEDLEELAEYLIHNDYVDESTYDCMSKYMRTKDLEKMFEKEFEVKKHQNKFYQIIK